MLALPLHSFFEDVTIAEWENPDKRDEAPSEDKILQNCRAVKPVWALSLKYVWEWPWSQRSDQIICSQLLLGDHEAASGFLQCFVLWGFFVRGNLP